MGFSVLMSVYGKENAIYFKEALDSVLHQTCLPSEIIIVEDGPLTDELYEVLAQYKTEYSIVKSFPLETNQGLGKALNYGLQFCSHEWVARCDSDDINILERFELQRQFISENPSVDVIGSNITEFGENIEDIKSIKVMPQTHEGVLNMMKRRTPMCHATVMFRKSKVIEAGGYQHLPYVEDYYLWARMANNQCVFSNINKSLVYVRVGNGMAIRRGNRQQIDSWRKLNHFMVEHKQVSKKDAWLNMLLIHVFVYMPPKLKEYIYRYILRKT